jgi:septal ring factor EnvC (AmiA/AmiB activator)
MAEIPPWLNQPSPVPGYITGMQMGVNVAQHQQELAQRQQQLAQQAALAAQQIAQRREEAAMQAWLEQTRAEVDKQYKQQQLDISKEEIGLRMSEAMSRLEQERRQTAAAEALNKLRMQRETREPRMPQPTTMGGVPGVLNPTAQGYTFVPNRPEPQDQLGKAVLTLRGGTLNDQIAQLRKNIQNNSSVAVLVTGDKKREYAALIESDKEELQRKEKELKTLQDSFMPEVRKRKTAPTTISGPQKKYKDPATGKIMIYIGSMDDPKKDFDEDNWQEVTE